MSHTIHIPVKNRHFLSSFLIASGIEQTTGITKKPYNSSYTKVFAYHAYTKISKIWSGIFSHSQIFWSFLYTKHIPNIYQIIYQIEIQKMIYQLIYKLNLKSKNIESYLLYLNIYSSNIEITNVIINSFKFEFLKTVCFPCWKNWVRVMDIVVLKRKYSLPMQFVQSGFFQLLWCCWLHCNNPNISQAWFELQLTFVYIDTYNPFNAWFDLQLTFAYFEPYNPYIYSKWISIFESCKILEML